MNPVLTFEVDGTAHCLHTDLIPLQSLGTLTVQRASQIEFNPSAQQWEVKDAGETVLFTNPSRSCCVEWEIEHFNQ